MTTAIDASPQARIAYLDSIIEAQKRSLEAERQRNAQLENELCWERELFYNPTLDPTDKIILWQRTPPNIKRGLPYDFDAPKQRVPFASEGSRIGIGSDTYSDRFKRLASDVGLFALHSKREEINGNFVPVCYVAPDVALAKPKEIDAPKRTGKTGATHGGLRTKLCKCGSANLIEKRQIICADCGETYSDPTFHPVNAPVNAPENSTRQDDGWSPEAIAPVILTDIPTFSNTPTPTPPQVTTRQDDGCYFSLESWLAKRIGQGQNIYATGNLDSKYKSFPLGHALDIAAYIDGSRSHIYGSPLRLPDGAAANVLCFDIDPKDVAQYAQRHEYLQMLTASGARPMLWQRRSGSCHIELYFDVPTNADAARAWCVLQCPGLASVEECYPTNQKNNGRVSWPLWYRLGNEVIACQAEYVIDGVVMRHDGIAADRQGLERIISACITPSAMIPQLPVETVETTAQSSHKGGVIARPLPLQSTGPKDATLGRALASFNECHDWDYVFNQSARNGRYSVRADDESPSIVVNRDDRTAKDYGRSGEYHDKFDWYLIVRNLDKKAETIRLIADFAVLDNQAAAPKPSPSPIPSPIPLQSCTCLINGKKCGGSRWIWSPGDKENVCASCFSPESWSAHRERYGL